MKIVFKDGAWKITSKKHDIDFTLDESFARRFPDSREGYTALAHLFSAAFDMYNELDDLLSAVENGLFQQAAPGVDFPAVMEKKHELRDLLKKARGEE